jgi:DNA invertase Pin-like site-specific DNA recombinase
MQDKVEKGRQARGEKSGRAVLDWMKVKKIRALYAASESTHKQIAEQFGVSRTAVRDVIRRKSWWPEPV